MSQSKKGRPKGSPNKLTKEVQTTLHQNLKPEFEKLGKYITAGTDGKTRLKYLMQFAILLFPKGQPSTNEGEEIRDIIFQQLKPQYRKLSNYKLHVSGSDWTKTMIELTKILTPSQQNSLLKR